MFWKKKIKIDSEEYKRLYEQIEIIKIDISMLQIRKKKKLPLKISDTPTEDLKDNMFLPE